MKSIEAQEKSRF